MSAAPTVHRLRALAGTLTELKDKARTALAGELAGAVGAAVRDALVGALLDRLGAPPRATPASRPPASWRDEFEDPDPWADGFDPAAPRFARPGRGAEEVTGPSAPALAAVAAVAVGRWWLARTGSAPAAAGVGALVAALGLAGGPLAGAVLAVLVAAADVLTAEAALSRH